MPESDTHGSWPLRSIPLPHAPMWPKSLPNPAETPATISVVARTALKHQADGGFDTQTISMETTLAKLTGFEIRADRYDPTNR